MWWFSSLLPLTRELQRGYGGQVVAVAEAWVQAEFHSTADSLNDRCRCRTGCGILVCSVDIIRFPLSSFNRLFLFLCEIINCNSDFFIYIFNRLKFKKKIQNVVTFSSIVHYWELVYYNTIIIIKTNLINTLRDFACSVHHSHKTS